MNGEYVEATGLNVALTLEDVENRVEVLLGDTSEIGSFDNMSISWLNEALKFSYATALDKMQDDILSNTHEDFLNDINSQLAGIINGFTHIDDVDRAVILAGWQQKFAGEFSIERTGSDALLLAEIARLKTEMARLGIGEGTSILDLPNPVEQLDALVEQQQAALLETMQGITAGFFSEFTEYVAGVDERQQQRDELANSSETESLYNVSDILLHKPAWQSKEEYINGLGIRLPTVYNNEDDFAYNYFKRTAVFYDGNVFEEGLEFNQWNYIFEGSPFDDVLLSADYRISPRREANRRSEG